MKTSIPLSATFLPTKHTLGPCNGQELTIHYLLNGRVLCQAKFNMTADTRFIELPIPVRHRLMMGRQ
jgi:hypothetical protein